MKKLKGAAKQKCKANAKSQIKRSDLWSMNKYSINVKKIAEGASLGRPQTGPRFNYNWRDQRAGKTLYPPKTMCKTSCFPFVVCARLESLLKRIFNKGNLFAQWIIELLKYSLPEWSFQLRFIIGFTLQSLWIRSQYPLCDLEGN